MDIGMKKIVELIKTLNTAIMMTDIANKYFLVILRAKT